jgi:hypothetical protein
VTAGQHQPSLIDELRKFLGGVQSWARNAMSEPQQQHSVSTCDWCPLCQFADVVRGDNPDVSDKIAEAGAAVVSALRAVMEAAVQQAPAARPADRPRPRPRPATPDVQHIELDDDSA